MALVKKSKERVPFRLILMPCCGQALCWVNPRLPNYCPECGQHVFLKLKFGGILAEAQNAWLEIEELGPFKEVEGG
jgi:hypothetical protein